MIYTLNVKLDTDWSADIEFTDLSTLAKVHKAIQKAVNFDNDHLYAFYVAGSELADERAFYDDENGKIFTTRIRDLFPLPAKKSLYYLFDFGDNWIFKVSTTDRKPHEPEQGVEYPRVVKETGEKPIQYDLDDDEF